MSKTIKVNRIADWAGFCLPCADDERPLVLTRSGPGGMAAWLSGLGDDDRLLLLTCVVCGHWQVVPRHEEDDPEIILSEQDDVLESVTAVLVEARAADPLAPGIVLVPRVEVARAEAPVAEVAPVAMATEMPVQAPVEAPVEAPVADLDVMVALAESAPPAAPRPRIETVPGSETLPAYSPDAVAAAAAVLAAARAETARSAPSRPAARRTPARPAVAVPAPRAAVPVAPPVAPTAPTSIALPAVRADGQQLVLAMAS